ncbi:Unknown protein [Striga hermonthica]|uniref:Uncharacterized protein n=1 Tax=Striga hermonthica TaxID=68872 RepID=A0A9N7N853_STRHE|nr:Unknown protein [Striga hermonthica]
MFGAMDILNKKAKRASVGFCRSQIVGDDESKAKLKYQSILKQHLELQKEIVAKKRKLLSAKQKRSTILAEVRFLRRRLKNFSSIQFPESDTQSNALQGETNHHSFEIALESHNQELVRNSNEKDKQAEGTVGVHKDSAGFAKRLENSLTVDRDIGKRKTVWPDRVGLRSNSVTLHS